MLAKEVNQARLHARQRLLIGEPITLRLRGCRGFGVRVFQEAAPRFIGRLAAISPIDSDDFAGVMNRIGPMKFTKMQGCGNDYVYVNGFAETVTDPVATAQKVADRHFGIGGDGLILILPSEKADVRMRMFNADGSEGEMCGNGVRCVAKYAFDHGLSGRNPMRVETGRGILSLDLSVEAGQGGECHGEHGRADSRALGDSGRRDGLEKKARGNMNINFWPVGRETTIRRR